jgi:aerotaxis receptor
MKKNYPVTGKTRNYSQDVRIVSLTDTKGIITHVNQDFTDVAGFSHDELLKQNHNIVRHPDMPPAAFADLWNTLKQNQPWIGIVKNRCKNGDHYWVNAYATPVFENGKVAGYQSVRTQPRQEWVNRADKLYKSLQSGKRPLFKWPALSMRSKYFAGLISLTLFMAAMAFYGGASLPLLTIATVVGAALSWGMSWRLTRSLVKAANEARAIYHNDVALLVYGVRRMK